MQVTTAESIPYLGDILSAKTFLIKRISFVGETCATSFSRYPQMQEENPDKQKIITLLSRIVSVFIEQADSTTTLHTGRISK